MKPDPRLTLATNRLTRMSKAELADATADRLVKAFGVTPDQAERLLKEFRGMAA